MIRCQLKQPCIMVKVNEKADCQEFEQDTEFTYVAKQGDLALVRHAEKGVFAVPTAMFEAVFNWNIEKVVPV